MTAPLPANFENWNPALRGAYLKGFKAHAAGEEIDSCPYKDKRKDCGRLTWSRSFISAWRDGWLDAESAAAKNPISQYYKDRRSNK